MDGVIYRGSELIDGAAYFVGQLPERNVPFRFLTNNSQRTGRDVAMKLSRIGIGVDEEHVFTCAKATARFLAEQKPGGTAFVIGEGGLLTALHEHGYAVVDHSPDYVVIGEGRTFNLELVEAAVRMIVGVAKLIATSLDPNRPTANGLRPGCGAMAAMLEAATGTKAFSVGKPRPVMMRAARKELGLATAESVMIGDTMSRPTFPRTPDSMKPACEPDLKRVRHAPGNFSRNLHQVKCEAGTFGTTQGVGSKNARRALGLDGQ